jgi:GAF domain-containing protein/HAMP domain-containing protein
MMMVNMNKSPLLIFLRRNWFIASLTSGYVLSQLFISLLIGFQYSYWQGLLPVVLMLAWVVVYLLGFRIIRKGSDIFQNLFFSTILLFIVGSSVIALGESTTIYIFSGTIILFMLWRILIKGGIYTIVPPYFIFLAYVIFIHWINGNISTDLSNFYWYSSSCIKLLTAYILAIAFLGAYHYQAYSIRNKIQLAMIAFGVIPYLSVLFLLFSLSEKRQIENLVSLYMVPLIVVGFAMISAFGILISRKIAAPLSGFSNILKKVEAGDFSVRVDVESDDVLGNVGRTINLLAEKWQNLSTSIELMVTERTYELERRYDQLRLVVETTSEISNYKNMEDLLSRSAILIAEKFGFDHVLLYLADEGKENLKLTAVAGYKMSDLLSKDIHIRVGSPDPVGIVAGNRQPRLVEDAAMHALNQHLPQTQSRMVFPLSMGTTLIGVLDLHSEQSKPFGQEHMNLLGVVANQLSISIENVELFQRMKTSIRELELLTGNYTRDSWSAAKQNFGLRERYVYQALNVRKRDAEPKSEKSVTDPTSSSVVSIPLNIRDHVIGKINFSFEADEPDPEVIETLDEMTDRLELILENARLIMEARNLAAREQQINQLTSQIRSSVNLEAILRTTVQELGKAFGAKRTFIQIGLNPDDSSSESPQSFLEEK